MLLNDAGLWHCLFCKSSNNSHVNEFSEVYVMPVFEAFQANMNDVLTDTWTTELFLLSWQHYLCIKISGLVYNHAFDNEKGSKCPIEA